MSDLDKIDQERLLLFGRSYGKAFIRLTFLIDQMAFSAGNFILTIMLARFYKPVELAGYGVGLSMAMTILSVQRNCYLVQNELTRPALMRKRAGLAMGQHYVISGAVLAVLGLSLAGVYALHGSYYSVTTLWMTIITYLIYSQLGFDRMMMVKHQSYLTPLIFSGLFAVMIVALFGAAWRFHISFYVLIAALLAYCIVKSAWLVVQFGRPDFLVGAPLAMRALRRYLVASILGLAGSTGFTQVPLIVLGAVAPPIQSAAIAAMRGLTQPLQIVVRSLDIVDKNFFHQKPHMTFRDMRAVFLRQTSVYLALAVIVLLIMAFFGKPIIHLAYGQRYDQFTNILLGSTLISGFLAVSFPIETGVVKLKRLNRFNVYRLLAGAVGATLGLMLCRPYGAAGAIIAINVGWAVSLLSALWLMRDILLGRESKIGKLRL